MKNHITISEREWASQEYHGFAPSNHENTDKNDTSQNLSEPDSYRVSAFKIEAGNYSGMLTQNARHEFLYNPTM